MALSVVEQKTCTDQIELEDERECLSDEIAMTLFPLTPSISESPDCFDLACEAAAFFAHAGIKCYLYGGDFETTEVGERVVVVPHYWLEVPLGTSKLFIDLTLPYWLTDPMSRETNFDIPVVTTVELSTSIGRKYSGRRIGFPRLVGEPDSSAVALHPDCVFSNGLINRYKRLSDLGR